MSVTATGERTQPGGVRKRAVIAAVIAVVTIFLLIQTANFAAITLALVIVGVILGTSAGVYAAATCEVFPTNVRYSSLSLGYSVAVSIFGGTTPLIYHCPPGGHGQPDLARLLPHRRPCRLRRCSNVPRDRQGAPA
jgi:hypothetical protein